MVGPLGFFAGGVAAGNIDANDFARQRQLKLDEMKWGVASKIMDQNISAWQNAYSESANEARQVNEGMKAWQASGGDPVIYQKAYQLYGNKVLEDPALLDKVRNNWTVTDTTNPQEAGQIGAEPFSPTRGLKHVMPPTAPLESSMDQLGFSPQQKAQLLGPYKNLQQPQLQGAGQPGHFYKVDMGPTDQERATASEVMKDLSGRLPTFVGAKDAKGQPIKPQDAMKQAFMAGMPQGMNPNHWQKLMPKYDQIPDAVFRDPETLKKIADENRKMDYMKAAALLGSHGDVLGMQQNLAAAGAPINATTQIQPPSQAANGETPNVQQQLGPAVPGQPQQGQAGFTDPTATTKVLQSPTSPHAVTVNTNQPGGVPKVTGAINEETSGPSSKMIEENKGSIDANTRGIRYVDNALDKFKENLAQAGFTGEVKEVLGGVFGQVNDLSGMNFNKYLQSHGVDINSEKVAEARNALDLAAQAIIKPLEGLQGGFGNATQQKVASELIHGLEHHADIGQTLTSLKQLRQLMLQNIYHSVQIAEPFNDEQAHNPEYISARGKLFQRYGMSKQMAAALVAQELQERGITQDIIRGSQSNGR